MAIFIEKNQRRQVTYKNDPEPTRTLFPNIEDNLYTLLSLILPSQNSGSPAASITMTDATPLLTPKTFTINVSSTDGITQASFFQLGKNLFDKSTISDAVSTITRKTITLKPNTTYTMSSNQPRINDAANIFFHLPSASESTVSNGVYIDRPVTLTTGSTGEVVVAYRLSTWTIEQLLEFWYQIEEGSTATEYVDYFNKEYVVNFPAAIKSGSVDLITGNGEKVEDGQTEYFKIMPVNIELEKGYNYFYSDDVTISAEYYSDIQMYIDQKTTTGTSRNLNNINTIEDIKQDDMVKSEV